MLFLKYAAVNFRLIIVPLVILFFNSVSFSQIQSENLIQGTWELKQVISSAQNREMVLNIKYSKDYNRYFGNIAVNGSITTLDSITFNEEKGIVTFSCHIRNKDLFSLTINGNSIEGTVSTKSNEYGITGEKRSNVNSTPVIEYGMYKRTEIPGNIEDLYEENGNTSSDIALLVVQGGPFDRIQYAGELDEWKDKLHLVFVKQAQIINPTILPPENNLSLTDAYNENLVSVEILHKVIQHFKDRNKKVLVWGVSYGAWIIQKYIAEYGITADAISIAAGRLDIDAEIWKEGSLNQTIYDITYRKNKRIYTRMEGSYPKPSSYLLASITEERYTKSLELKDLSKLVLYQYGNKDGTVGRLTKSEIDFLRSKNVETEVCNKCYHRQMLSRKTMNSAIYKMLDFVNE